MDSLWCLRDLPFHKMQSGVSAMLRQSVNGLDVSSAMCSRSNCALGFCQSASCPFTYERRQSDGQPAANRPYRGRTTYPLHFPVHSCQVPYSDENPGFFLECCEGLDCSRHHNQYPTLLRSLVAIWPGTGESISPSAIFNGFLFKVAIRSDRLCTLVSCSKHAFVTAFHLQRTLQGHGLKFQELMNGRIKMMTAMWLAWAHTYQTMCLGFSLEQLRQETFQVSQTQEKVSSAAQLQNSLPW